MVMDGSNVATWYTHPFEELLLQLEIHFNPVGVTGSDYLIRPGTNYFFTCRELHPCRTATSFVINATPTITNTTPDLIVDLVQLLL
jgi:hypothetical protein